MNEIVLSSATTIIGRFDLSRDNRNLKGKVVAKDTELTFRPFLEEIVQEIQFTYIPFIEKKSNRMIVETNVTGQ